LLTNWLYFKTYSSISFFKEAGTLLIKPRFLFHISSFAFYIAHSRDAGMSSILVGTSLKLNYRKKAFYFALNFLHLEFLNNKKLAFEKTKTTFIIFKKDFGSDQKVS
jgi:hypothetical protein